MKKSVFLLMALMVLFNLQSKAQQILGLANSNYGGTHTMYMNPSSIADSRYHAYVNLAAVNINLEQNYLSYNGGIMGILSEGDFSYDSFDKNNDASTKLLNLSAEVRGPSFMFNVGEKSGFGFSTRMRTMFQVNNLSQNTIDFVHNMIDSVGFLDPYTLSSVDLVAHSYTEVGFTYAREVIQIGPHYFKAGVTLKRLTGMGSAYLVSGDIDLQREGYTYEGESVYAFRVNGADTHFGGSFAGDDLGDYMSEVYGTAGAYLGANERTSKGWGWDFGLTYEHRPNEDEYTYTMDGEDRYDDTVNKYDYKIGFSLMDIGHINYFTPYTRGFYYDNIAIGDSAYVVSEDAGNLLSEFETEAERIFGSVETRSSYRMALPTAMNVNFDYRLTNHIYANVNWLQNFRGELPYAKTENYNSINTIKTLQHSFLSITPRIETRFADLALPISWFNNYQNFALGLSVRTGVFFFGSDNIGGLLGMTSLHGLDFYMGLTIPVVKRKPSDRDDDQVSNKLDVCKDIPGVWEFKGCPDTDGDGVEDKMDSCISVPGVPYFFGCPDTDGDSIRDNLDECPKVFGLLEFGGCPDTDGDGVENRLDSCVYDAGLPEFSGCPDTDNDSIPDHNDKCPEEAGPRATQGCPDKDGDGILDEVDECPEVKGIPQFRGCPDQDFDGIPDKFDKCPEQPGLSQFEGCPDRDLDGIPDHRDNCPDDYGIPENKGCPLVKVKQENELVLLTEEETKILREAFDNLEFETGKAVLRETSYISLVELVKVLEARPEFKLLISGHTDSVGSEAANLKLSQTRAEAVKIFLVKNGRPGTQIISEGFGEGRPIASNKTNDGRQKNRRVEFKIIK